MRKAMVVLLTAAAVASGLFAAFDHAKAVSRFGLGAYNYEHVDVPLDARGKTSPDDVLLEIADAAHFALAYKTSNRGQWEALHAANTRDLGILFAAAVAAGGAILVAKIQREA